MDLFRKLSSSFTTTRGSLPLASIETGLTPVTCFKGWLHTQKEKSLPGKPYSIKVIGIPLLPAKLLCLQFSTYFHRSMIPCNLYSCLRFPQNISLISQPVFTPCGRPFLASSHYSISLLLQARHFTTKHDKQPVVPIHVPYSFQYTRSERVQELWCVSVYFWYCTACIQAFFLAKSAITCRLGF